MTDTERIERAIRTHPFATRTRLADMTYLPRRRVEYLLRRIDRKQIRAEVIQRGLTDFHSASCRWHADRWECDARTVSRWRRNLGLSARGTCAHDWARLDGSMICRRCSEERSS